MEDWELYDEDATETPPRTVDPANPLGVPLYLVANYMTWTERAILNAFENRDIQVYTSPGGLEWAHLEHVQDWFEQWSPFAGWDAGDGDVAAAVDWADAVALHPNELDANYKKTTRAKATDLARRTEMAVEDNAGRWAENGAVLVFWVVVIAGGLLFLAGML